MHEKESERPTNKQMSQQKNCIIVGLALSLVTCLLYIMSLQTLPMTKLVLGLSRLTPTKRDTEPNILTKQPACVPVSYNTRKIPGIVRTPLNDEKFKTRESFLEYVHNKSRCERWRLDVSIKLGELVQRRLDYLQNPKNCSTARKLVCEVHRTCGFGCKVNTIGSCLMLGYATQRTVVVIPQTIAPQLRPLSKTCLDLHGKNMTAWGKHSTQYQVVRYKMVKNRYKPDIYPPAVPSDLAKKIDGFHGNAFVWWAGQISKYIFRHSPLTLAFVKEAEQQSEISNPIVGVHIRRTDKLIHDAKSHSVEEYMTHVETWYKELEKSKPGVTRKIFLASDDPTVGPQMKSKYPNYTIIFNNDIASSAGVKQRKGFEGQSGITHDIYMLSKCDLLVCTFSSNNPKNCSRARKFVCELHKGCGFGCKLNTIAMCLMIGYATQRTVIVTPPTVASQLRPLSKTCMGVHGQNTTNWGKNSEPYQVVRYKMIENQYMPDIYPPAVPADLAKKIDGFHGNAFIWWAGQISKYIFRQSPLTLTSVKEAEQQSDFSHPIVGVHIRRTDKLEYEADSHSVEEYMTYVETWYGELEKSRPGVTRKIFLASDEPQVGTQIKSKYSNYTVIFNNEIASSAGVEQRDGFEGQAGIIHDIYMLSKCDFLVCTFSSNVCRLAYQLLQTWHGDATNNVISLDEPYLFCFARSDPLGPTLAVKMPTYDDVS